MSKLGSAPRSVLVTSDKFSQILHQDDFGLGREQVVDAALSRPLSANSGCRCCFALTAL